MRMLIAASMILIMSQFCFSQTDLHVPIEPQSSPTNTSSKPQSKVWKYNNEFYSVFPNNSGTYIWKLDGKQWNQHLLLTTNNNSKADCYAVSDTVFILLFQGQISEFTVLKFEASSQQYQFLNPTNNISRIMFDSSTETATIAFDSKSTLWMTYEANNNIEVRNSISPYMSWSSPKPIFVGVANDDISGIIKMSNSVGVLWSNQNTERFGFKFHIDGDPISVWSSDEVPASQSALNIGKGMADDHINIKYTSQGELFAAIKTSYDTPSYPKIGLLIRRADGTWDNLHHINYTGTRPLVTIDTSNNSIKVYYTSIESGGDILLKESTLNSINFGQEILFLDGNTYNNVSSTKFPYDCINIVIASDDSNIVGNVIECR
jgi:hypothetical protein